MKKLSSKLLAIAFVAGMFGVTACSGNKTNEGDATATDTTATEAPAEEAPAATDEANTVALVLNSNDKMQYDKTELHVKAGQKVTLTLNHTGKMPITAMGHNFVLLNQGVDINAFAKLALAAKDNGYIPNDPKDIIAHTKLIGGGESDEITFDAPAAGTYDYICSFPGHHSIMHGKFIVE